MNDNAGVFLNDPIVSQHGEWPTPREHRARRRNNDTIAEEEETIAVVEAIAVEALIELAEKVMSGLERGMGRHHNPNHPKLVRNGEIHGGRPGLGVGIASMRQLCDENCRQVIHPLSILSFSVERREVSPNCTEKKRG